MNNIKELQKTFQKRNFYTTRDSSKIFLYTLILPFVFGIIFTYMSLAILQGCGVEFPTDSNPVDVMFNSYFWFSIPFMMITQIVFICLFFGYNKMNRIKMNSCSISFKKANIWTVLLSTVIGILSVFGFIWLIEGCFGEMFRLLGLKSSSLQLPLDNIGWYFLQVLLLAVVPAICEELLFRGIVFKGLKENFSPILSIILSATLFALIHQNIQQFIYPFLLGTALAIVMERTNNLLYPMIIHFFNNFTTLTINYLVKIGAINLSFNLTWWGIILAILIAGIAVALFYLFDRFYLKKHSKIEQVNEGELIQPAGYKIGKFPIIMLIGVVISISFIVINAVG